MVPYQLFLSYLLFLDPFISCKVDYVTQNCRAFKSGAFDNDYNRICHNQIPTDEEVQEMKLFFEDVPYSWLVNVEDHVTQQILQKNGLCKIPQSLPILPLMILDLNSLYDDGNQPADFIIQEVDNNNEQEVMAWLSCKALISHTPVLELVKLMKSLQDSFALHIKLYIGYYQKQPVATTMIIIHQQTVAVHLVSTAQVCRKKGFASAIVRRALCDVKNNGCKQAILISSASGRPMYERIGFKESAWYAVYGNYSSDN